MARNERIDLRVEETEKQTWEAESARLGVNVSELIRQAVRFYLEHLKERA